MCSQIDIHPIVLSPVTTTPADNVIAGIVVTGDNFCSCRCGSTIIADVTYTGEQLNACR
jgi:hypothetical protein